MEIRVSCVQLEPKLGDKEYNIQKMESFINQTMKRYPDTDLIVMPELTISGYEGEPEVLRNLAESIENGESIKRISSLAKKYGIYIVYGLPEKDSNDPNVFYNSAVLIDKYGNPLGTYKKVHPFATEKRWCVAGEDIPVFDTELGKIGIMICWDVAFPELARCLALKGADILIVSTDWEDPYEKTWEPLAMNEHEEDWELVTSARAFDNTLYLAAANRVGNDGGNLSFLGRSRIVDPRGRLITALNKREEGIISARINLDKTRKLREMYYTFFDDRVPSAYAEITKER